MKRYNRLLEVIVDHIARQHIRVQTAGLGRKDGRGFTLPRLSETSQAAEACELVT